MSWFVYTILGVFCLAVFYLLQRIFLREKGSDVVSYAIVFNIVCAILLTFAALPHGFVIPNLKQFGLNLGLMAILYTASQVLIFKSSQTTEASELIIFSATRAIWTIIIALLFLGESLNPAKTIGTIFILGAIALVSVKRKGIRLRSGHLYALAAAFCIGVGFANDSFVLRQADAFSYGALAFILPGILTLIIFPDSVKKIGKYLHIKLLLKILLLGIFYSVGFISLYFAYQNGGNASQIAPISQSVVIITVILAAIFLGERKNLFQKFIASVLVSIGVLLLR